MKPDSYMPLYGNDLFQAIEGLSDTIGLAYIRVIWYYWHHNHCRGLRDESEFLRRLCRIEKDEWTEATAILFDNDKFFTLGEDGLWHQKRTDQEWQSSVNKYQKQCARTHAATQARRKHL